MTSHYAKRFSKAPPETIANHIMQARLDHAKASPEAFKAMLSFEAFIRHCGIDPVLLELVKIRASQINQCAYCLDMHTKDARAHGESEQRIYALNAWREAPFFSDRERAALAWTEAVTLVASSHVPDDVYATAIAEFSEFELVNLTAAVNAINCWNRLAISFRMTPGDYQPPAGEHK